MEMYKSLNIRCPLSPTFSLTTNVDCKLRPSTPWCWTCLCLNGSVKFYLPLARGPSLGSNKYYWVIGVYKGKQARPIEEKASLTNIKLSITNLWTCQLLIFRCWRKYDGQKFESIMIKTQINRNTQKDSERKRHRERKKVREREKEWRW